MKNNSKNKVVDKQNNVCKRCWRYRGEEVKGCFYAVDGEGAEVLECPKCGHKFRKNGKQIQPY